MPSPFPFNPAAIPVVPVRKAILILDLQNAFLSPDSALYVGEPEGFVDRTLDIAKAFRDSGAGDVIWVRSEFERHRSLMTDGDQIITSDRVPRLQKVPTRGRQPKSSAYESAVMEADEEAFLSVDGKGKRESCVRKGTREAEFAPEVQAAIVTGRDIILCKSHYSAFASEQQQLVQLLRRRFVTQIYVCGSLSNISIFATALDAGKHGYEITLIEDCCGFRKSTRHLNAVHQLMQLTGCEVSSFSAVLEQFQPPAPPSRTTGLSPSISKLALELSGVSPPAPPAAEPRSTSRGAVSPQRQTGDGQHVAPPPAGDSKRSSSQGAVKRPSSDDALSAHESEASSSDRESTHSRERKPEEARRKKRAVTVKRSELASSKGPLQVPEARGIETENISVKTEVREHVSPSKPDKKVSPPPSKSEKAPSPAVSPPKTEASPTPPADSEPQPSPIMTPEQAPAVCSEPLCEGDTTVIANVLSPALAADAFERLLEEVSWAGMSHMGGEVPRRIAVQGDVAEDGSMPVYRHPADESPPLLPFSPTVLRIKKEIEVHLGHPVNHVLIQHYRTGNDYISEHSDKTIDVVPGSFIANVSLGAERTMVFRTKRPPKDKDGKDTAREGDGAPPASSAPSEKRAIQRAALPHNSLLRMGLATNARWLHAIRPDKRADRDKTPAELSHRGARISLTFRRIGTFIDASQTRIWGQGARSKTKEAAGTVLNGQTEEAVQLLRAMGRENHESEGFDWQANYGRGFDVLHMGVPKRFCAGTGDRVANARIGLALAEMGVSCAKGSVEGDGCRFEDNDPARTVVEGHANVLRYLDAVYGVGRRYDQLLPGEVAKRFVRLQKALDLLGIWRAAVEEGMVVNGAQDQDLERGEVTAEEREKIVERVRTVLAEWEGYAQEEASTGSTDKSDAAAAAAVDAAPATPGPVFSIAGGNQPSPADFALWPVLHDIVRVCGEEILGEHLSRYYAAFKQRSSVAKVLGVQE